MMCGNCASQELYSAGEEKFGTDEGKFVNILSTRSVEHLREGMHVCVFVCECVCVCVCVWFKCKYGLLSKMTPKKT